jgi:aspartate aminotransferase
MAVAQKMLGFMENSSWIRKMFEEGTRLKQLYGADKVFDFSLGNPNVPTPEVVHRKLRELVQALTPGMHGYMPNAGLPQTRAAVAAQLSREKGVALTAEQVIMTCGAAGALNIILKALLDPGDEVLSPVPCFVEYGFYTDNHGGVFKTVPTREDFTLDLSALAQGIGPRTKVVLINSPNNPTGQIYSRAALVELVGLLEQRSRQYGHPIYLVSDEPYSKIVYDDYEVPSLLELYRHSLIASSYSKDLSIPGERLGFVAVHPEAEGCGTLLGALTLANRILGFVNAPALQQRLIVGLQGVCVDVSIYRRKRDLLVANLRDFGYDLINPPGAFYLFPKSPIPDDVRFVQMLQEEKILVVPGAGFGGPGHFRLAYCVDDRTIEGSLPGFQRALQRAAKAS